MPYSSLTTGIDALVAGILSEMAADGFTYDTKTKSLHQIFATMLTDLGGSGSYLTLGFAQTLAAIRTITSGGTVSHLNVTVADLLAGILNDLIAANSGNSPPDSPPVGMAGRPIGLLLSLTYAS